MQISSRFTIALHMLTCMEVYKNKEKVTSNFMADSIGVNPVVVRRILGKLKEANLINVIRGSGGAEIKKDLSEITFLDIYRAVESVSDENLFSFHESPNPNCPVGRNIHYLLDDRILSAQIALEKQLQSQTLKDLMNQARNINI